MGVRRGWSCPFTQVAFILTLSPESWFSSFPLIQMGVIPSHKTNQALLSFVALTPTATSQAAPQRPQRDRQAYQPSNSTRMRPDFPGNFDSCSPGLLSQVAQAGEAGCPSGLCGSYNARWSTIPRNWGLLGFVPWRWQWGWGQTFGADL